MYKYNFQKEIRACKKSLEDDGGFMELVNVAGALMKKQAETLKQIELHCQQYGYQPLQENKQEEASITQPENYTTGS